MDLEEVVQYKFQEMKDAPLTTLGRIDPNLMLTNPRNGTLQEYIIGQCDIKPNVLYNLIKSLGASTLEEVRGNFFSVGRWGANTNWSNLVTMLSNTVAETQRNKLEIMTMTPRRPMENYYVNNIGESYQRFGEKVLDFFNKKGLGGQVLMHVMSYAGYCLREYNRMSSMSNLLVSAGDSVDVVVNYMYYSGNSIFSSIRVGPTFCMQVFEYMSIVKPLAKGQALAKVKVDAARSAIYHRQIAVLRVIGTMSGFYPFNLINEYIKKCIPENCTDTALMASVFNQICDPVIALCSVAFNKVAPVESSIELHYLCPEDIYFEANRIRKYNQTSNMRMRSLKYTGFTFDRVNFEDYMKGGLDKEGVIDVMGFSNKLAPKKGKNDNRDKRVYRSKERYGERFITFDDIKARFSKTSTVTNSGSIKKEANILKEKLLSITNKINEGSIFFIETNKTWDFSKYNDNSNKKKKPTEESEDED